MKTVSIGLLFSICFSFLSLPAFANEDLGRATELLQADAMEPGAIVVAHNREQVQQLAQKMNRPLGQHSKAVVVTGKAAQDISRQLQHAGVQVQHQGSYYYHKRVLIMVGPLAWEFEKVLVHVYGHKIRGHHGLTVIKGQLHEVAHCIGEIARGALNLGVRFVGYTADLLFCGVETIVGLGSFLLEGAGFVICKTAEGVVLVAKFALGTIANVAICVGETTIHLAKDAVVHSYRFVNGVFRAIGGFLRDLFTCTFGCSHYKVKI